MKKRLLFVAAAVLATATLATARSETFRSKRRTNSKGSPSRSPNASLFRCVRQHHFQGGRLRRHPVGPSHTAPLKTDAERVFKAIEGVEKVDNQIEVLPVSPNDARIGIRAFRAIYGYSALQRYALPVIKPIRIIVKGGHITLVDSGADKNLVNMRARGVSGAFSVTTTY